jgi:protocatechuate 3,4-dioxygenase beta subunit
MTGAQLFNSTAPQGSWTVVQDSGGAATEWGTVTWNTEAEGSVPPGTAITVEARAADTEAGLGAQPYVVVSNGVEFALFGRFIQVRATLEADDDGNSPVLSDIRIQALANDPATLELTPETDTNTAGDEHCVVATVEDQSGAPVEDVIVDFSVSGPNGPLAGSDLTDANGQADFCYTGTHAGDDTITATAQGGTNPSDTATKTYAAAAPATLDVEPATATNVAGDEHCVTATVEDEFGNPVPGVTVDFAVSGPNANGGVGVTDANGVASFCYTGTHAGDDTITATAVGGTAPSDTATKTWQPDDPATLDLGPPTATNTAGDEHCVTATVRDQFDNPVPGVTVNFAVFGANTNGGAEVTDANGVAVFCYTGTVAGDDDIVAMAVGGTNPSDTAEKTWEPDAPATLELAPTGVTNTVDEEHCVTATVRDQFGNPTPGITVHFSVSPTTFRTPSSGSSVTDASGEAEFCYTSAMPGGDVISAFADANGNGIQDPGEPSDTATKTWVIPANQVGCMVTYGATFTAANGDRASAGGNAKGAGPSGQEQFQDHGPVARMNVHSINVLSVTCSPDDTMASIFGEATIDGAGSFDYRIDLKDPSGPGPDTYRIRLGNGYDSGEQAIRGNVQIH